MFDVVKMYEKILAAARIIAAVPDPELIIVKLTHNIRLFLEDNTDKELSINSVKIPELNIFLEDGVLVCLPTRSPVISRNLDSYY